MSAERSPVAASLYTALGHLLPICAVQSCAINELNKQRLAPKKDHEANCIWP